MIHTIQTTNLIRVDYYDEAFKT